MGMRSFGLVGIALLTIMALGAAANVLAADGSRSAVDVDVSQYRHWPAYEKTPIEDIRPQPWRRSDDVIEGWDWSLPPEVAVKDNSLLCVSRSMNKLPKVHFSANPVISLWVFWSDLEPEEGDYRFDTLIAQLKQVEAAGYGAIIRPMTAVYARPSVPDPSKTPKYRQKPCAPPYLVTKYNVPQIPEEPKQSMRIVNLDVAHPDFHRRYVKFVHELGQSGIPRMDVVKGLIVGYKSSSWGDEGIGPRPENKSDGEEPTHVRERLDAWAEACEGVESKVCMGGVSEYGFSKGFGVRGGFVEMYLYRIPDAYLGQEVDAEGYLVVNEDAPGVDPMRFAGDENEEYEEKWTHRFGKLESFVYRNFTSNLRLLQMRRNYLLNNPFSVYPEMLPFVSLEMGRTVEDTPDVWCALRESVLGAHKFKDRDDAGDGVPVKNFERWLYQRDSEGYETRPAVKIDHSIRMWMVHGDKKTGEGKFHDYIARSGKRIGFAVDDRFLSGGPHRVAVKITYLDEGVGDLSLHYSTPSGKAKRSVARKDTGKMTTATFFLDDIVFAAKNMNYDLSIEGHPGVTISFVRLIKR